MSSTTLSNGGKPSSSSPLQETSLADEDVVEDDSSHSDSDPRIFPQHRALQVGNRQSPVKGIEGSNALSASMLTCSDGGGGSAMPISSGGMVALVAVNSSQVQASRGSNFISATASSPIFRRNKAQNLVSTACLTRKDW